jgi:(R,R)-butanediol dehydrogenase / meso-butanediol dehydrogenase / diacetyl reductase
MRAAFFVAMGTFEVRNVEPQQAGNEDALLEVRYCGVCGSDLSLFKTGILSGPDKVMGHEISAVVVEDRTGKFEPGARVVPWPWRPCGQCMWCLEDRPMFCTGEIGGEQWGGYAEYAVYPTENLIPIPEELDDRTAALTEPLGVGLRGVRIAGVQEGDLCFVGGLGSIGLLAVAALVDTGARVIGADPREDRRSLGEKLGCELVFDPVAEDPWWKTLAVDPHGPRFSFECSGVAAATQQAINVCGQQGTVVLLGMPIEPATIFTPVIGVKEQRILSIAGPTKETMRVAIDILVRRPEVASVITSTVPLEDAERAMHDLVEGHGGVKVLVEPAA